MRRSNGARRDIAAEITQLIIDKLEAGVAPWSRPWRTAGAGGRPLRHCGTPYTGINTLMLWAIGDARGYRSRHWMTYRQAQALGAQVRKGETGSLSVYYSTVSRTETDEATGEDPDRKVAFLKAYTVFNVDQIDGLPERYRVADPEPRSETVHRAEVDGFVERLPMTVRHGGNAAFYDRGRDLIQMPHRDEFVTDDCYASTLAHEATHWTGHPTRLARTFGKRFGDRAYAFEELVAEIGAGMMCAELGLPNQVHDGHASYVDHWLGILKADKTAIIHAASRAEQAFSYLRDLITDPAAQGGEVSHGALQAAH